MLTAPCTFISPDMTSPNTLPKDVNSVAAAGGVSDLDGVTILPWQVNHTTGALKVVVVGGTGGSSLTQETATGTIDGSNTIFGLVYQPVNVLADGILHPVSASVNDFAGNAVTWSAGVLTFNALTPPNQYVVGYYNS